MQEYCKCESGLVIKVFCQIISASACEGNCMSMYIPNVETETVEKLVDIRIIHENLRKISSCKRLTGTSAKPDSSPLNHLRNEM